MCAIAFLRVEDMQRCLEISDEEMLELGIGIETVTEKPDDMITKKSSEPQPEVTIITTSTTTQKTVVDNLDPNDVDSSKDPNKDPNVIHDNGVGPKAEPSNGDTGTLSGVAIGFSVVLVLALAVGGLFLFRLLTFVCLLLYVYSICLLLSVLQEGPEQQVPLAGVPPHRQHLPLRRVLARGRTVNPHLKVPGTKGDQVTKGQGTKGP